MADEVRGDIGGRKDAEDNTDCRFSSAYPVAWQFNSSRVAKIF